MPKLTKMNCDQCGYTSFNPSSMWYHRKTHNGIKPFKCNYCNYSALVQSTLTMHMKRRHGFFPLSSRPGRKPNFLKGNISSIRSEPTKIMNSDKKKRTSVISVDNMYVASTSSNNMLPIISSVYTLPDDKKYQEPTPVELIQCSDNCKEMVNHVASSSHIEHHPQQPVAVSGRPSPSTEAPVLVGLLNTITTDMNKLVPAQENNVTNDMSQSVFSPNQTLSSQFSCITSTLKNREKNPECIEVDLRQEHPMEHGNYNNQASKSSATVSHYADHNRSPQPSGHIKTLSPASRSNSMDNKSPANHEVVEVSSVTRSTVSPRGGQSRYPYRCNHCALGFEEVMMYIIHMGCHGSPNPFQCNACGHVCSDKFVFASHLIVAEHGE
ncbi:uncharacterized protein LOC100371293 [Saccoglossus kowalevskii]|uniref:DNA-binding protein Ikaros-like n=1 Tax=Saccoglossus kowalevskii TaxID=10224 RepID=A0ABM0GJM4_SACKO|nr:PREDICTED: DNA-binding protein Ikaros-like [Saccoglossus kowalevskii]